MTVGQLLAAASSRELGEWMALYKIEFDEEQKRDLERQAAAKLAARGRG